MFLFCIYSKRNTALIFPNSIEFTLADGSTQFFASFISRDKVGGGIAFTTFLVNFVHSSLGVWIHQKRLANQSKGFISERLRTERPFEIFWLFFSGKHCSSDRRTLCCRSVWNACAETRIFCSIFDRTTSPNGISEGSRSCYWPTRTWETEMGTMANWFITTFIAYQSFKTCPSSDKMEMFFTCGIYNIIWESTEKW